MVHQHDFKKNITVELGFSGKEAPFYLLSAPKVLAYYDC
jgi:hypothetical protein